jgi:hemolysin activation/secretion protein
MVFFLWILLAVAFPSAAFAQDFVEKVNPPGTIANNPPEAPEEPIDADREPPKKSPLRLQIKEIPLGQVRFEGNGYYLTSFLRRHFHPVLEGPLLQQKKLDRTIRLINEFPDLRVNAILMLGKELSSTDLLLQIKDARPVHLTLESNNFRGKTTGNFDVTATLTWGDITGHGDVALIRTLYAASAIVDFPLFQIRYTVPIGIAGTKLDLSYARSHFAVGEEFIFLDIRGENKTYDATVTVPWKRETSRSIDTVAGVSGKSAKSSSIDASQDFHDEIRSVFFGINWSERKSDRRHFVVGGTMSQGLGTILGGTGADHASASRTGAKNWPTKINFNLRENLMIGERYSLQFRASGQLASQPLLVSDQFGMGGADSVRGFTQGEGVGDNGVTASGELRASLDQQGRFFVTAFVDSGISFLSQAEPGQESHVALTGAGFGLRAGLGQTLYGRIDIGIPISPSQNAEHENAVLYLQMVLRL